MMILYSFVRQRTNPIRRMVESLEGMNSNSVKNIRPKIANYIRMHPGTSFKTIKTIFTLTDSTLRYHLRYLEKNGQIKSDANKRIYYPTDRLKEGNLSRVQQRLIHFIKEQPGITQKELSAKVNMNRLTIRRNTNFLIKEELLSIVKLGKEIHHFYEEPEELRKIKMRRLITKLLLDKIDEETYWDLRRRLMEKR